MGEEGDEVRLCVVLFVFTTPYAPHQCKAQRALVWARAGSAFTSKIPPSLSSLTVSEPFFHLILGAQKRERVIKFYKRERSSKSSSHALTCFFTCAARPAMKRITRQKGCPGVTEGGGELPRVKGLPLPPDQIPVGARSAKCTEELGWAHICEEPSGERMNEKAHNALDNALFFLTPIFLGMGGGIHAVAML